MKKVLIVALVLAVGLIGGGAAMAGLTGVSPFGSTSESRNTQIIQSIERQEQVVLLSLGIQGIAEERVSSTVFGRQLPGSGRALFLQYTYNAKLGIEGAQVTIEPTGENAYLITIPEFIFIGHDDVQFRTALEENGVLSWTTPDIDTAQVISEILSDAAQAEHVVNNQQILEEQAIAFYSGIISGVDDQATLDFEFTGRVS